VKNVTISLDDSTYRRVRILAAERDLSISGFVKRLVSEFEAGGDIAGQLKSRERVLREQIRDFRAGERLSRDAAHERRA
jgi:hypothetical protein